MFLDPAGLSQNLDALEDIERASLRLVCQALVDFREEARRIFAAEADLPQDFGEDITREALDQMGVSRIPQRLFGKIDYKRARYLFHPDYAVRQALFVDSKAEKLAGAATATLQTAQTSLRIRHVRQGEAVDVPGEVLPVLDAERGSFLTTTLFVKYNYIASDDSPPVNSLESITVAAVPHQYLQDRYNPDAETTIWRAGRNAPSRGEAFRVRLVFRLLEERAAWRVQRIPMPPKQFIWAT